MKFGETALLIAVRQKLLLALDKGGAGFARGECEIECDEMAPTVVGNLYVVVMPGGWRPGPRHNSAGGVHDLVYGVDVLIIKRTGNTPRDRFRELMIGSDYLGNLDSLNDEIDRVVSAIDFDLGYKVNAIANDWISKTTGSAQGFIEPLKMTGIDKRPRVANAEIFGGTGQRAGLLRAVNFHGARRITTRT